MSKELSRAEEKGILRVPELFDVPEISRRRVWLWRRIVITAFAVCLSVAAIFIAISVLSGGNEKDGGELGGDGENNEILIPESESERDAETEREVETVIEEATTEQADREKETESEADDESGSPSVIEKDLSETWRGEGFIVNFTDESVDVGALLDRGFVGSDNAESAPVVMIIHTHTSEGYVKGSGAFKGLASVVSVGEVVTDELRRAGVSAIHCTVIHDSSNRNAYLEARETIETMLKIYPSIRYVIDLHRMVISENGIPIKATSVAGVAQVRLSVSAENREIGDWRESLSLALSVRREMNSDGDGICMPIVLTGGGYNSDMSVYHLIAEVGTDQNSIEEAMIAGRLLARAIAEVVVD